MVAISGSSMIISSFMAPVWSTWETSYYIFAISPFASFLTYTNQEKGYNLEFGNKGLNPHKNFLEWSPFFCITQQSSRHCAHDGRTSFTWKSP
jgi:hypothetical protein